MLGGWLAALLGLTFYVRRWIGPKLWRQMHRWTLAVYVLAVIHTLGSGDRFSLLLADRHLDRDPRSTRGDGGDPAPARRRPRSRSPAAAHSPALGAVLMSGYRRYRRPPRQSTKALTMKLTLLAVVATLLIGGLIAAQMAAGNDPALGPKAVARAKKASTRTSSGSSTTSRLFRDRPVHPGVRLRPILRPDPRAGPPPGPAAPATRPSSPRRRRSRAAPPDGVYQASIAMSSARINLGSSKTSR